MADLSDQGIAAALRRIDKALPTETAPALSLLFTASATKSIEAGISDARAVDHFLSALQAVRATHSKERVN